MSGVTETPIVEEGLKYWADVPASVDGVLVRPQIHRPGNLSDTSIRVDLGMACVRWFL